MNTDLPAAEWGKQFTPPISRQRAQRLCQQERVKGARMAGGMYWVPKDSPDPRRPHGRAGQEEYYKKPKRKVA